MNESLETWRRDDGWTREIYVDEGKVIQFGTRQNIKYPPDYEPYVERLEAAGYSRVSVLPVSKTLKQMQEGLTLAHQALLQWHSQGQHTESAIRVIEELMREVQFQRPTGPDGKHGKRHTLTCGCDHA